MSYQVLRLHLSPKVGFIVFIYPTGSDALSGNIAQIFDRDSWPFLDSLTNDYQPVVKLHGLFGVYFL